MNNNIKVVEYTQGVGRRLNNIRNYNPRTTLHGKLPQKRDRALAEYESSTGDDYYHGYFKLLNTYSEDGNTAYIVVVDGDSWNGTTSNPSLCKITYANNFTYQSYYNRYYANSIVKDYSVSAHKFTATAWADGVWYIYLVCPFMKQPYLYAVPAIPTSAGTNYYYLIGTVTKTTADNISTYVIHQEHNDGLASVIDYQYSGYFKIIDTSYIETTPPEVEGDDPIETPVYQVAVCDGATWNGTTSGSSLCTVNNASFSVSCTTLAQAAATGTYYIYLHFTAQVTATPEGETEPVTTPASVALETGTALPTGNTTNAYYLIGSKTNGVIAQSHASGIPIIKWYMICPAT